MPVSSETISTRQDFLQLLEKNDSVVILKFGAEWCGPCKTIEADVQKYMDTMPENITCMILDVDECFDLYAYLKSKKIIQGIPCILAYFKGNTHFAPDEFVSGTKLDEIERFFEQCRRGTNGSP